MMQLRVQMLTETSPGKSEAHVFDWAPSGSMQGKTVVITGGTSGIGEVAAKELARMGARIIVVARDKSRADATLARLRQCGPGLAHCAHLADLTRIAEMKRVAAEIAAEEPRIDVLINNAGALFGSCQQRFRSYDSASGTYMGYDGMRHSCPWSVEPPPSAIGSYQGCRSRWGSKTNAFPVILGIRAYRTANAQSTAWHL
jgi:short subunit dehydrogenase/BA14K-like protein